MTPLHFSLPLAAAVLAGPIGLASAETPGSTPHTYSECQTRQLSDQACHRQIVTAGGVSGSSSNHGRAIVPKNFRGWSERERWYRKYVEYARMKSLRVRRLHEVFHYYPGFPMRPPYHDVYPPELPTGF